MTGSTNRVAILMHTDNLDEMQRNILKNLITSALGKKGIVRITQEKVDNILQITIYYTGLTYALYDLVWPLQNPNGAFSEPRKENEIQRGQGVLRNIDRTKKGFLMVLSGDIRDLRKQLENPVNEVELNSAIGGEKEKLRKIKKIQQRVKRIRLPKELSANTEEDSSVDLIHDLVIA